MAKTQPVALITGGAIRVGRAITWRLASAGYDVAFTYMHSRKEATSLQKKISRIGRTALAIQVDFNAPQQAAQTLSKSIRQHFGRLDVLVNNASIYKPARLSETRVELVEQLMRVHVQTPLLLCQTFEKLLRKSHGHVVNMIDLLAERPWPQFLAYCASKAALGNLTLGLARELAPQVTVNGIAPGVVQWPDDYPQQEREKYLQRVPLARPGTPEDVAELVHFLVTGGSYITGQIIRLDGGRSIT
ncbi:MAG: SDR family oxidoreductase [Phycisphaerales bacterium]|jgi:pteridine reductase|nr:SDR family oxidoreductase [Phycisphaerales bacterium]